MKKSAKQKDVAFTPNPILSVRLPMWRSKLVVFLLFMAFVALAGARVLDPGPWQRVLQEAGREPLSAHARTAGDARPDRDRNGLVLATSLPVKAIWAIPEAVPNDLGAEKLAELAKLLDMTQKELREKLSMDKTFVYVKRQVRSKPRRKSRRSTSPAFIRAGNTSASIRKAKSRRI